MTIKKIFFLFNIIVFLINERSFAQMAELPFSQKVEHSSDIFEGKVIHKNSFWNTQHTLMFTSNTIEVYKVFKGNIIASEVEIVTEGGNIGDEIQGSESSLYLNEGYIGIFMAEPSTVANPQTKENKIPVLRAYGSAQGFIKYDLLEKTAADPFKKYNNIQDDLYKAITDKTGQSFQIIKPFSIDGVNSKKGCCWFKCCKKKHKNIPSLSW